MVLPSPTSLADFPGKFQTELVPNFIEKIFLIYDLPFFVTEIGFRCTFELINLRDIGKNGSKIKVFVTFWRTLENLTSLYHSIVSVPRSVSCIFRCFFHYFRHFGKSDQFTSLLR